MSSNRGALVRILLTGDVMLGRGVDQILPFKVDPILYEDHVKDAREYVQLAVMANGAIPKNRPVNYVWGDAINILESMRPDVRVINLETAVTTASTAWPQKGINYRMHPGNVEVIQSANIDCCVLSNNHVLDWGYQGLSETIQSFHNSGIKTVGAGESIAEAESPAIFPLPGKGARVLVFGAGHPSAGVPSVWKADMNKAGVFFLRHLKDQLPHIANLVKKNKKPGDIVVFSVHWGSNWSWSVDAEHRKFAHGLIEECGVDVVHGHSSHHVKGVEVYKGKLICYGCGDFLSDYEGIRSSEDHIYRDDLSFMYFADIDCTNGNLSSLSLTPMRLKHIRLNSAENSDRQWLFNTMRRECRKFDCDLMDNVSEFRLKF